MMKKIASRKQRCLDQKQLILKPNSTDDSYKDIIIRKEDAEGMKIVGEFIRILD